MEENTKNQENKSTEELEQEKQYNTYDSEAGSVGFKETKGEIKSVIDDAKKMLESMRFKKFLESKGLSEEEYKGPADLKDESLSKEFSEYKLDKDDPDVVKCYTNAKNKIIGITDKRNDKINELYGNKEGKEISEQKGKVQQLLEDVDAKIAELQGVEGKEEELKKLEEIKQKIGDKEQKSGLFQKLDEAAQKQMSVRRIALEDFSLAMDEKINGGKEMVMSDKDIKKAIGELDKDGKLISQSLNEVSKGDDLEKDKEEAEKTEENKEKTATAPKGTSVPTDVAKAMQQMAGQQVVASEEPVEPKAPSYADILGYNSENGLNYDSSINILGVFMGSVESPVGTPITDDLRIALLNSPEGAKIVQQALMKINSQDELGKYNFIKRLFKKHDSSKMNKKVMAMIEKQLPAHLKEKSDSISKEDKEKIQNELKKHGVDIDLSKDIETQLKDIKDPKKIENLENNINSLSSVYDEKINELKDILKDKELSDEDRKRYSQQLENITNKKSVLGNSIQNYVGVYKFNDIAKDAVKGEMNQKYALNSESTIKDIPDDKPEKTFGGQNQVYSEKERTQKDIENAKIAEEKHKLDQEIQRYYDENPNKDCLPEELQQKQADFNNKFFNSINEEKQNREDDKIK